MKEVITVIRIEHKDGNGLWRANDKKGKAIIRNHSNYASIEERHHNVFLFPPFQSDYELNYKLSYDQVQAYHFAFLSVNQLEQAFSKKEITEFITKLGFKVYLLKVTKYYKSSFQVVFKKESILNKTEISSLFL